MAKIRFEGVILASVLGCTVAHAADENAAEPWANPWLADTSYSVTHGRSNYAPQRGPEGPTRVLREDEYIWKPVGPANPATMHSPKYPNGKRVVWIGGFDRISKLDDDTLETLATYAIGGTTFYGPEDTKRRIEKMDAMDDDTFAKYMVDLYMDEPWPAMASWYRLLSKDNELFFARRAKDGTMSIQVYGEDDPNDPASRIRLRREWQIPKEVSRGSAIFGMNMTSDGWLVFALQNGSMVALARDFSAYHVVQLPGKDVDKYSLENFRSFVRNSVVTDDQGGAYVVTRDNMHRVQWTGKDLSLKESDGAWSAPYPNELEFGSGTTPSLMGWGPKEDHLVVIADGTNGNNMMVFWRDKIPENWEAIPGYDRRVAGVTKVSFGVPGEKVQVENSIVIHGYGAFLNTTDIPKPAPLQVEGRAKQWVVDSFYMHVPGYEPKGGTQIRWDPEKRKLYTAWQTDLNLMSSICQVSGPSKMVYCWGARNREWTLEGIDWNTGKSAFHYTFGKSHAFNPFGGPVIVAPNGAIDLGGQGGLAVVRVKPGT